MDLAPARGALVAAGVGCHPAGMGGHLWRQLHRGLQTRVGVAVVIVACAAPVHLFFFREGWGAAMTSAVVLAVVTQVGGAVSDAWRRRRSPAAERVGGP